MIEVIQEENWECAQDRRGLPKNIKQVGVPDVGDRIYIENTAYQKMHPYGQNAEKMVYVMLGRFDDFAGHTCIFVEDVVKMNEVEFNGKLPVWNEDSWGYLYRKIRPEHENMIIVGWAVDICGQLPSMTAQLERVHQTYFGGIHQILLLMDTLEGEEAFFCNRNGYLKRREGFYIYYDKAIPERMEAAVEALRRERSGEEKYFVYGEEKESNRVGRYREYLNDSRGGRTPQLNHGGNYSSTLLLLAVIFALGYSSFLNHQKMEDMEFALNRMELQAAMQTEVQQENVVRVEEVMGNITSTQMPQDTQAQSSQTPATQTPATQIYSTQQSTEVQQNTQQQSTQQSTQLSEETVTQTASESDIYLAQGYYVVQPGENLAGICRKIYHTTAMMEKLCEVNGIDDPDAIFAGQRLILPD